MNYKFLFVLSVLVISSVLHEVGSANCELKARINRALKELPIVEEIKHKSIGQTHKSLGRPLHNKRSTPGKRTNRQSIPLLAKNIESFLQKSVRDLHLCTNSTTPRSDTDTYGYGAEYICSDIPPEDYISPRSSTTISWQRFPKSTSTRSHPCDDSEESTPKPPSEPIETTPVKEECPKASTIEYPITKSISQLNAMHYLEIRHIFEFLNFLMSHLVCKEPEDPVEYLVDLLKKCLKYRDSFGEPPLLFTSAHIKSLYTAFDPFGRGFITEEQYHEAMKSLGLENSITPYNREPSKNEEDCVEESYFLFEAERCLTENLRKMLRIPKIWEENRLVWKKRMKQNQEEVCKSESLQKEDIEYPGEGGEIDCKESVFIPPLYFSHSLEGRQINCQLEQLYF